MAMFQYSICDMHFGIVKFNGFCQKLILKITDRFCSVIKPTVKSGNSAIKKNSNKIALMSFHEIENNFRGNMKPILKIY